MDNFRIILLRVILLYIRYIYVQHSHKPIRNSFLILPPIGWDHTFHKFNSFTKIPLHYILFVPRFSKYISLPMTSTCTCYVPLIFRTLLLQRPPYGHRGRGGGERTTGHLSRTGNRGGRDDQHRVRVRNRRQQLYGRENWKRRKSNGRQGCSRIPSALATGRWK